jgi:hypothetical protein
MCAYLNARTDIVFSEVSQMVHKLHEESPMRFSDSMITGIVQDAFSITCDFAPDGSPYHIGLAPKCPKCGEGGNISWNSEVRGPSVSLPAVSHNLWESFSLEKKHEKIKIYFDIQRKK